MIGIGYVGLVTGAAFARFGHQVICVDVVPEKVLQLQQGKPPFFEKDLDQLVSSEVESGRLVATLNLQESVSNSDFVFLSVPTPSREDGSLDATFVIDAAAQIGECIAGMTRPPVIVVKSTVLPGTTAGPVRQALEEKSGMSGDQFGLAMNPEFLREGSAVTDSLEPDRIVVGAIHSSYSQQVMDLYAGLSCSRMTTSLATAEMIKYTSNALLATKITFANQIANLCEVLDCDVDEVMDGVGLDHRISRSFLSAGRGFGGSCFPKDVAALWRLSVEKGREATLLREVLEVNERQPLRAVELLETWGDLSGKVVSVLGLTFKPDTDDVRQTRARPIVESLLAKGAEVIGWDPVGVANFAKLIGDKPGLRLTNDLDEALDGTERYIIQSGWKQIRDISVELWKARSGFERPLIVDACRVLDRSKLKKAGIALFTLGTSETHRADHRVTLREVLTPSKDPAEKDPADEG